MKRTISVDYATESFVAALIDDVSDTYASNMGMLKEWIRDKNDLANIVKTWPRAFTIAIFSLEMATVVNLFTKDKASMILNKSIENLSLRLQMDERLVVVDIDEYMQCLKSYEEKEANPVEDLSQILYRKLGIKELDLRERLGVYAPDPVITTALGTILATFIGRWKRITEVYDVG